MSRRRLAEQARATAAPMQAARRPGTPLPASVAHGAGPVRIHTDARSVDAASSMGAAPFERECTAFFDVSLTEGESAGPQAQMFPTAETHNAAQRRLGRPLTRDAIIKIVEDQMKECGVPHRYEDYRP